MEIFNNAKEATIKMYKKILEISMLKSGVIGSKLILTRNIIEVTNLIPTKLIQEIYIPIKVYTNKIFYFITDRNRIIIFSGKINEIGIMETIYIDIQELNLIINATITLTYKDNDKFNEFINLNTIDELIKELNSKHTV